MNAKAVSNSSNYYIVLFGTIMLSGLLFLAWIGSPVTISAVGERLPPIDLRPLVGAEHAPTLEDLQGKVVVLHFWGTWSPASVAEYPEFSQLAQRFADSSDVEVISVSSSAGPEYDLEQLKQQTVDFMNQMGATTRTYADPAALTRGKLALLLPNGTFSYPTTILVDRDGRIVATMPQSGPGTMERLAEQIEAML